MTSDITVTTGDQIVAAVAEVEEPEEGQVEGRDQRGMVSAEWTVGIIAAIAIAGVLLAVVTSGPVESLLLKVVLSIIKTFTRGL
jgi:hypothetical protein